MRDKKFLLVFPPLSTPTSPPLGMAMLKGYVERELPDWTIETLDINLWCFNYILNGLRNGDLHLTPEAFARIGTDLPGLLRAADIFKGSEYDNFFNSGTAYDICAKAILEFIDIFCTVLEQESEQWEKTRQLSPLLEAMIQRIDAAQPDMLGISAIFSHQLPVGAALGSFFRTRRNMKVFFGGGCFTEGVSAFLKWYPESADAVVSGDGEDALKSLLLKNGDPKGIPGVFYLENGEVTSRDPIFRKEIDEFGLPDFSGYDLFSYYSPQPVVALLLSRGCYWRKCTFCVHYFSAGDSYRVRSFEQIIELLRMMVSLGVRHFSFVDEMIAPGYFAKLAEAIENAGLDIAYYALSKPNRTFTPKVLNKMARSGCRYVLWGMESGNQRILNLMDKGTQPAEIGEVLKHSHAAGISNHVYVICGFPTETREEYAETIEFLRENRPYIQATHRSTFSLEAGSPISKEQARFGIIESWVARETSLGGRLGYRTSSGMSMEEARDVFQASLSFLKSFNDYAQYLANFRDHALLVYDHQWRQGERDLPEQS